MDREHFDALTRHFAASPSRRAAIGALLGAGLAGPIGAMEAKRKTRKRNRRQKQGQSALSAEAADCLNPGPSSNMNRCNFNNEDLSGHDLSSSSMRETRFRGANLCGADLSSSQLKDANFRGFAAPGRVTNLTRADLHSSACKGTSFNDRTVFCRTRMCNGAVNDRDCPEGLAPEDVCCGDGDCSGGQFCVGGTCRPCPAGWIETSNGSCGFPCGTPGGVRCEGLEASCKCFGTTEGDLCVDVDTEGGTCPPACPRGSVCLTFTCLQLCGPPTA